MGGSPIIPISFDAKVIPDTEDSFTVIPGPGVSDDGKHLSPKEVVEYVTSAPTAQFHATPIAHGGDSGSGSGGDGSGAAPPQP